MEMSNSFILLFIIAASRHAEAQTGPPTDIAFCIDNSGSIRFNEQGMNFWQVALNIAISIVQGFNFGESRFALADFGYYGKLDFNLRDYSSQSALISAINSTQYTSVSAQTNLTGGLRVIKNQVFGLSYDGRSVRRVIIVISDGRPTYDTDILSNEIIDLRAMGIAVFAIGITSYVNEDLLRSIVTLPASDNYINAGSYAYDMGRIMNAVTTACWRYSVYTPAASTGYSSVSDIVFVIDNSGSIRDNNYLTGVDNWQIILQFVIDIVKMYNIAQDATRIALIDFADLATLDFNLDDYATQAGVLAAINRTQYLGQNTNTTGGLKVARMQVFGSGYRWRSGVTRTIILITDGVATYDAALLDSEAATIRGMGISIVAIGITNMADEDKLRSIVTQPASDSYIYAPAYTSLSAGNVRNIVLRKTSNSQWAFTTQPPPNSCTADIAFVLDNTESNTNWAMTIDIAKAVVRSLGISQTSNRIAAVDFGNYAKMDFHLRDYSSQSDITSALDRISHVDENSNITGGLKLARTLVFYPPYEQRPGVNRVVVLISDGVATRDEDKLDSEADALKAMGVRLLGVGITNEVNDYTLRRLVTSPSNSSYIYARDSSYVEPVKNFIISRLCNADLTTPRR